MMRGRACLWQSLRLGLLGDLMRGWVGMGWPAIWAVGGAVDGRGGLSGLAAPATCRGPVVAGMVA